MRLLDLLQFAPGALLLSIGWFAPMGGGLSTNVYTIIFCVGLFIWFHAASGCVRMVTDFGDDLPMREGLWHAAIWVFRLGAAFWIWMALALSVLSTRYPDMAEVLMRGCVLCASTGGIVFLFGVAWFVIYAAAKSNVHRSAKQQDKEPIG